MPRQAPASMRLGTLGETEVSADFERLGWAALLNARGDIGTDLLLSARTEQGVDLGLLVAAQVKTGLSFFREPSRPSSDEPEGWWFRDSARSHVDSWAEHVLPHLIILRDPELRCSYWAHVTVDAIRSTGSGAKILVPRANRIDEANRAALVDVAESIKAGSNWEGSAWSGIAPPSAADGLRYALIAPRLLAPHPNVGTKDPITPEQGVALLVQGRARNYESFAQKHAKVPSLDEARNSSEWKWRLVGALAERILADDPSSLLELVDHAPDAAGHSAVVVASTCALLDQDRVDEALAIIETALGGGQPGAVDRAWLMIQHARLCLEIGRVDDARHAALEVQRIRSTDTSDVTAGALAGAAAALLFNTSPWEPTELENAITSGDTVVTWWRSQTTRHGLDALAERNFKEWAREAGVTFAAEDTVAVQLLSASMLANHAADQGGWRHLAALSGQARLFELDRHAAAEDAGHGLASLIRAGDSNAVKNTVRHLLANGPAAAIAVVANELRLLRATRTTALAELSLLQYGGSVLSGQMADQVARFLIDCVFKPQVYRAFVDRTSPTYLLDLQLLESLAGVIPAAGLRVQRSLIKRLIDLPPQRQQILATAWRKVVLALPPRAWTAETALRAKPKPRQHESSLQLALLGIASGYDDGARRSLLERARRGSLGAISSLGDVTRLPPAVVKAQIGKLADAVAEQADDARRGSFGMPVFDLGHALVVLNCWHPELAQWQSLLKLLAEPRASTEHKSGAITALASSSERIPDNLREDLGQVALDIANGKIAKGPTFFESDDGIAGRATILAIELGAIDLDRSADPYVELLAGEHSERVWAAHIATRLARPPDIGVLAVLADDRHPEVRAAAGAGLARLVAADKGGQLAASALCRSVEDAGIWVPRAIAGQLATANSRSEIVEEFLDKLREHPAAPVNQVAKGQS